MRLINLIYLEIGRRIGFEDKVHEVKQFLTREEFKSHRRIGLAGSLIALALIITVLTNCSGPQIAP